MLSASGRCKTFDASANGYVRGEGVGGLVVACSRQLDEKVIISISLGGSAVRQDGMSASLTAPNRDSQMMLLRTAWRLAGQHPDLIEAHGSGTPLGDPIEVQATLRALPVDDQHQICIGALKAQFGAPHTSLHDLKP